MIKLELNLTPTEANTLCGILSMAIDHYTYCVDETVNSKWIWGLMADLSKAVVEENEDNSFDINKLIESMHMVCKECGVKCKEVCEHCPVKCNANAIHAVIEEMED